MPVYRCPSCSLKSSYETAGSLLASFVDRFVELRVAAMAHLQWCDAANRTPQPAAGEAKVVADDVHGTVGRCRHLFGGHPAEVVHLDDVGERCVLSLQRLERAVQVQQVQLLAATVVPDFNIGIEWHPPVGAAPLGGPAAAGVVAAGLPPHTRHQPHEMRPAGP